MSTPIFQPSASTHGTSDQPIVMYTTTWCSDCRRAKRVFAAMNVPYTEIDIEVDAHAADLVTRLNDGARSVPTILFPDGTKLVEPSNATLEAKLAPYAAGSRQG